jgi:hypothetical protein
MSWTLCTSGSAILRAGANANSTIIASGVSLATWSDEAEGKICTEGNYDFVTNYSTLDTQIKNGLADACSSIIASNIVAYDMSGYTDRREAETILDLLDERITRSLQILKNKNKQHLGEA